MTVIVTPKKDAVVTFQDRAEVTIVGENTTQIATVCAGQWVFSEVKRISRAGDVYWSIYLLRVK